MRDYQVCVITKLTGDPPVLIAVAAVAWGGGIVDVLAPDAPGIETVIRAYLTGIPVASVHEALVAFASASHPYAVKQPQAIGARSAAEAAISLLQVRGLRAIGS